MVLFNMPSSLHAPALQGEDRPLSTCCNTSQDNTDCQSRAQAHEDPCTEAKQQKDIGYRLALSQNATQCKQEALHQQQSVIGK